MTHIIVDTANLFFRARHSVKGPLEDKIGMAQSITFNSIRKAWKDFDGTHVIFALEGRSWRKDYYPLYKKQRHDARGAMSVNEAEEDRAFWEIYDEFVDFLREKTNCTILQHKQLEADDLIAGWTQQHPNEDHVIISTDGDFAQLISKNVKQYNGMTGVTTCIDGYFDEKGKKVIDKKTNAPKPAPDPEWLLFLKCIRGDTTDNIFSAFPGVRIKGSSNKVGLTEAYQDRHAKGFNWNNLMLQRWVDHLGKEHKVVDDYKRNVLLCDLTAQPTDVRLIIEETINNSITSNKNISQVGIRMMQFCVSYDLIRIAEKIEYYAVPFATRYQTKVILNEN